MATLEEIEQNTAAAEQDGPLTPEELAACEAIRAGLSGNFCRRCGSVSYTHLIYGPEQDPQQTLEVLAKLACFHPDKDAERINAAAGAAENLYTPLLASTLGLISCV